MEDKSLMAFILLTQQSLSAYNISCCGLEAGNTILSKASFSVASENSLRGLSALRNGECGSVMNTIFETRQSEKQRTKITKVREERPSNYMTLKGFPFSLGISVSSPAPTTSMMDRVLFIGPG